MSENKTMATASAVDAGPKAKANSSQNDGVRPAAPKKRAATKAFAHKSSTAITLGDRVNATVALVPLVQAFTESGGFYGYPIEVTQSLVVMCGERPIAEWLRDHFAEGVNGKGVEVLSPLTSGPTNFFHAEGRALVTSSIKSLCDVLMLIVPALGRKMALQENELASLLEAAHMRCHTVIVVFQALSTDDAARLTNYFDVVFNIEACEPDHGYKTAYTIAPAPGTLLAAIGPRPVIDNIRLDAEGQIERYHYECVSPNAMTREIAKLIQQKKSYTEIAAIYEVNKTTIMRRVDALPFIPKNETERPA